MQLSNSGHITSNMANLPFVTQDNSMPVITKEFLQFCSSIEKNIPDTDESICSIKPLNERVQALEADIHQLELSKDSLPKYKRAKTRILNISRIVLIPTPYFIYTTGNTLIALGTFLGFKITDLLESHINSITKAEALIQDKEREIEQAKESMIRENNKIKDYFIKYGEKIKKICATYLSEKRKAFELSPESSDEETRHEIEDLRQMKKQIKRVCEFYAKFAEING